MTTAIDVLVQKVQAFPDPAAKETALELVQAVMDLHAAGLERMLEITCEAQTGGDAIESFGADALVSSVLLLHDLHPLDLESRVVRALDKPEFRARGSVVELISVEDGIVRLRIEGGHGLQAAVEAVVLEAAPDAARIVVEGAAAGSAGFVPLTALTAG